VAKKYQMVRLSAETHDKLAAVRAAMQLANIDGKRTDDCSDLFGLSMDLAVAALVEEYWRHRAANKSKSLQEVRERLERELAAGSLPELYNGTKKK